MNSVAHSQRQNLRSITSYHWNLDEIEWKYYSGNGMKSKATEFKAVLIYLDFMETVNTEHS